jgi:hypothetical protein
LKATKAINKIRIQQINREVGQEINHKSVSSDAKWKARNIKTQVRRGFEENGIAK